jgi:hypothetical protein
MDKLTALSLSIAGLAGFATFLAVGPANGVFLIWAATIPWAGYFFLGANREALINMLVCGIFGIVMAWITALLLTETSQTAAPGFAVMAAITVAVSVAVMCLAAKLPQLSTIPASVLGYSSTFAYLLQTPEKLDQALLLSPSLDNALVVITLSFIVGTYLGQLSGQLAAKWTKE